MFWYHKNHSPYFLGAAAPSSQHQDDITVFERFWISQTKPSPLLLGGGSHPKLYPKNPDPSLGLMVETSHPQNNKLDRGIISGFGGHTVSGSLGNLENALP